MVKLANPYKTRVIAEARIKNDRLDAKMLAHLLRANLIAESYVLSAALSLNLEAEIEINEEERKFTIPIELFRPMKLDLIDLRILKLLSQGAKSLEDIVESLNVDRRIIEEKLKRLIEEGLVEGIRFSWDIQN